MDTTRSPGSDEMLVKPEHAARELIELLDGMNASVKRAHEHLMAAGATMKKKPPISRVPRERFPFRVLLPYALGYLAVVGYCVGYVYLSSYYSTLLPGLPIEYPVVSVLSRLLGYPMTIVGLTASMIAWPALRLYDVSPEWREKTADAALHLRLAERATKRGSALGGKARQILAAITVEARDGDLSDAQMADFRDGIANAQMRLGDNIAELDEEAAEYVSLQRQLLKSSPWDLRWPLRALLASNGLKGLLALMVFTYAYIPLAFVLVVSPFILLWAHRPIVIMLLLLALEYGPTLLFVLFVWAWRSESLMFVRWKPAASVRKWGILLMVGFLLAYPWSVGKVNAHWVLARPEKLCAVRVESSSTDAVEGFSVPVVGSDSFYILESNSGQESQYVVVPAGDVLTVRVLGESESKRLADRFKP